MAKSKKKATRKPAARRVKPKTKTQAKSKSKPRKPAKASPKKRAARTASRSESRVSAPASAKFPAGGYTYAWQRENYETLKAFWPFYLHEHSRATNRMLHFVGSTLGLVLAAVALGTGTYILLIGALVSGYAFAWFGHFFIEKNRPATFKYPLKSFISDWRMWYTMLTGKIGSELRKYGIASR